MDKWPWNHKATGLNKTDLTSLIFIVAEESLDKDDKIETREDILPSEGNSSYCQNYRSRGLQQSTRLIHKKGQLQRQR